MKKLNSMVRMAPITTTQPTTSGTGPAPMSSRANTATPTFTMEAPCR